MTTRHYTTSEVAQELHISPAYLRKLTLRSGIDASHRTEGGQRRFTSEDVERMREMMASRVYDPADEIETQPEVKTGVCPKCLGTQPDACGFCGGVGRREIQHEVRTYSPAYLFKRWDVRDVRSKGMAIPLVGFVVAALLTVLARMFELSGAVGAADVVRGITVLLAMLIFVAFLMNALMFITGPQGAGLRPTESGRWELSFMCGANGQEVVLAWRKPLGEDAVDSRGRATMVSAPHEWHKARVFHRTSDGSGDDPLMATSMLAVASGGDFDFAD